MGRSSVCWLGNVQVGETRYDVDPQLMRLFRRQEKVVSSPNHQLPQILRDHWAGILEDDPDTRIVFYSAPVGVVRDRLDLFGYTAENVRSLFDQGRVGILRQLEQRANKGQALVSGYFENLQKEMEVLNTISLEVWQENFIKIVARGLETDDRAMIDGPDQGTVLGYMLSHELYGFPYPDDAAFLRSIAEAMTEDVYLTYDLTDLISGKIFHVDTDFVELVHGSARNEFSSQSRIVVLTEGSTDAWILSESLRLLFPHLRDYYSFMEFEGLRVGGGTGNLVNLVKAFAGSGIVNRTVAVFDNDTAGEKAIKSLSDLNLPSNIRLLKLPDLDFLRDYPTLGPTGKTRMDVNGLAASIELYLGSEVLSETSGSLIPVQWTGFDSSLGRYQGEVLDKRRIQAKYKERLRRAKTNPNSLEDEDWQHMRLVLKQVFAAFNAIDAEIQQADLRYYFDL